MSHLPDTVFWDERYRQQRTEWDMGIVSPPLKAYIDQLANKQASLLIPGCGNAYEADYLLQQGFTNITLIDLSPTLTARLQQQLQQYGERVRIITGDFFALQQSFDIILEQTFFCALHPSQRLAYAQHMHRLLAPKGRLAGLLFNRSFPRPGPPFGGSKALYQALFAPYFHIRTMHTAYNSIPPRAGKELFIVLEKKDW